MAFSPHDNHGYEPVSEINVTPLVDVMLVLLVVFMVTAPMMVQGVDVNLPKTTPAPLKVSEEPLTLTFSAKKELFMGHTLVKKENLKDLLTHNVRFQKDKEILLKADETLSHGVVMEVMTLLKEAGAEKIGIVTDSKENG